MKSVFGGEAVKELSAALLRLKHDHMAAGAVVLEWSDGQLPVWAMPHARMRDGFVQGLEMKLGEHGRELVMMWLEKGSVLVLGEKMHVDGYKLCQKEIERMLAEDGPAVLGAATVRAYDLSVDWTDFFGTCQRLYEREKKPVLVGRKKESREELLARLERRLDQAKEVLKAKPFTRGKMELLFVEDDPALRKFLATLLAKDNLQARFTGSAEEAVESYCTQPPHMVFLDIELPDLTGLEVLRLIKQHDPKAYVIILTGHPLQRNVDVAKEEGVKGFIVKPFSRQKLLACMERFRQEAK